MLCLLAGVACAHLFLLSFLQCLLYIVVGVVPARVLHFLLHPTLRLFAIGPVVKGSSIGHVVADVPDVPVVFAPSPLLSLAMSPLSLMSLLYMI